jgi:hypothetical protein
MHFIRENLAVCGFASIGSRVSFVSHGFRAQLQCTEPFDPWLSECVEVMSAPFTDGAPIPCALFHSAQNWLAKHWDSGGRILISCAAGQSRSVTMAAALLCLKARLKFVDAVSEVITPIPGAYPHPYVLASAASYCAQPFQFEALQSLYASIAEQPPYPWSRELVREAAEQVYS